MWNARDMTSGQFFLLVKMSVTLAKIGLMLVCVVW
jgi:hypothetical protein